MKQPFDEHSDEELLRLMLAGDQGAFAGLYQRWQSPVYRFALRLSESEVMAEDVMQEVFLTLIRDGHQFAARGTFASYILSIARHGTIRRLQRERRFITLETDNDELEDPSSVELPTAEADPLAALTRNEQIAAVRVAVLSLPLHYREVVLLCHLHELSYGEAADVIGCSVGTVCSRLYRARALLAVRLAELKIQEPAPTKAKEKECLA